jgi:dTDP-glucose 4,6-dehydratase
MKDIDVVFHLAALIAIPYSYLAPLSYLRTNIEGTLNILQAALNLDIEKVVHTSTSEVYGSAQFVPIDESHPLRAQSPYSATKIGADKLVEAFHLSYGIPITTVRPFNTFGPRQSARAIIPTIITQCLTRGNIRIGNLDPTRDLNYIANIVDGFVLAGSRPAAVGQTINFGSNRETSIRDLVRLVSDIIDKPIKIEIDCQRIRPKGSEVERLLAKNTLAMEILGWKPTIRLEDGLKITVEWIKQNLERYEPDAFIL